MRKAQTPSKRTIPASQLSEEMEVDLDGDGETQIILQVSEDTLNNVIAVEMGSLLPDPDAEESSAFYSEGIQLLLADAPITVYHRK